MRTTLVIDDAVLREAKQRAAQANTTLSKLTTQALREALRRAEEASHHSHGFVMPTYGSASARRDSSTAALAALRDEGR